MSNTSKNVTNFIFAVLIAIFGIMVSASTLWMLVAIGILGLAIFVLSAHAMDTDRELAFLWWNLVFSIIVIGGAIVGGLGLLIATFWCSLVFSIFIAGISIYALNKNRIS